MAIEQRQFNRQELLTALEQGWKQYLAHLHTLSEEELVRYAQQQGYTRVQDVLAHVIAWWERSMHRSHQIINGQSVPRTNDMDAFNAEVVKQYQQWTRDAVEARFEETLDIFEHFLKELPEHAFENERIQLWLRIDAIDHYEDHRLPNAPKLQLA
ncbi:ClbS/DfsB family four-helix bundle protein [Dictyobacter aurantiacus]|uniref:ClbS/DfsB family four-helix bundle protein n=1 Tax=Dictyobacter aurantiacus TaxID=1936993 RepID=A0A401ZRF0_9CHLR|nr:ClbS/DfsB family four-helix bundle protein [Dictyobacter aurantiacus]GCE09433.1 hypothetical protein KDAU_67620 [Dictyobacter aurantiacus]